MNLIVCNSYIEAEYFSEVDLLFRGTRVFILCKVIWAV